MNGAPLRELPRRAFLLLLLGLTFAPPFVLIVHSIAPPSPALLFAVPGLCGVLALGASLLLKRMRYLMGVVLPLGSIALAVAALVASGQGVSPASVLYAAGCAGLSVYLLVACATGGHSTVLFAGFAIHLICGVVARNQPYVSTLFWLAFAYLACYLCHMNTTNLREQCVARGKRPARSMRMGNLVLCAALLVLGLVIAEYRRLMDGAIAVARTVVQVIVALLALLQPAQEPMTEGIAQNAQDFTMSVEAAEPALFWVIAEKIVLVLAYAALAALLIFLLTRIPKFLRRIMEKLRTFFSQYFGMLSGEYTDEAEELSGWSEWSTRVAMRARKLAARLRPPRPWRDMDNRERVRSVYARLRSSTRDVPGSATAQESFRHGLPIKQADATLLAESYDRARYSDHAIGDEEAENARRAL